MLILFILGEGSTGAKGSSGKTVKNDSCVRDEAEISAEKHCLMHTVVDKPNEDRVQPLSKDSMTVTANKQHTSDVHRYNVLCSETAIIPLLEDQLDDTILIKRVKASVHDEMSKIVDGESQNQGVWWNIFMNLFSLQLV